VSDFFDLLAGVGISVVHCVRLQAHDLLTLVHVVLKGTSLVFQLLALHALFSDVVLELLLGLVDSLDSLLGILLKLLDLILQSLLVLFILLLMLSLDNLLSLLCDTIELDVLGPLFEIFDFQIKSLLDVLNPFEISLELADSIHELDLVLALLFDSSVLDLDDVLGHKDSIFVVSGDRQLRDLDPPLLDVDNALKVVPDLLDSISGLLLRYDLAFKLLFNVLILSLQVVDMILKLLDLVLELLLVFVHFGPSVSLLHESTEVFLGETVDLVVLFVVVLFPLVFLLQDLLDSTFVHCAEWI